MMRTSNVGVVTAVAAFLYLVCCGMALGQTAGGQPPARQGKAPAAEPQGDLAARAATLMGKHNGSLLRATLEATPDPQRAQVADVSFFAVPPPQPKVIRKHDLVTIIVREQSDFRSSGTTELKKQAAINAQLQQFIHVNFKNFAGLEGDAIENPLGIKGTADSTWKGDGSVDRSDNFTARVQAEVLDVKPNGTLVLQGTKTIKNDEEEQRFIVTGVCRAEDVTADNTVLSTQLLDLNLERKTKGAVRNANKRGWLPKLLDAVSPF